MTESDHYAGDVFTVTEDDIAEMTPQEFLFYLDFIGVLSLYPDRGILEEG